MRFGKPIAFRPWPAPAKKRPGNPPYAAWLRRAFHVVNHVQELQRAEPGRGNLTRHVEETAEFFGYKDPRVVWKALREHKRFSVPFSFRDSASIPVSHIPKGTSTK
jgi:hypothetical protein